MTGNGLSKRFRPGGDAASGRRHVPSPPRCRRITASAVILPDEAPVEHRIQQRGGAAPLERSSRGLRIFAANTFTKLAARGRPDAAPPRRERHRPARDEPSRGVTRIGLSPLSRPNDELRAELRRRTTACPDLEQGRAGVFKRRGGSPLRPRRAICRDVAEHPGPLDNGPGSDRAASWSARPARRCEPGRVAK